MSEIVYSLGFGLVSQERFDEADIVLCQMASAVHEDENGGEGDAERNLIVELIAALNERRRIPFALIGAAEVDKE